MPIAVKCPQCGSELEVPDGAAGKKASCPDCAAVVTVPRPPSDDEAADILLEGDPDPAIAAAPAGTAAPAPAAENEPAKRPARRQRSIATPSLVKPARNGPARLGSSFALLSLIPGFGLLFGPIAILLGFVGLLVGRSRGIDRGTRDVVAALGVGLLTTAGTWALTLYGVSILGLPAPMEQALRDFRPRPIPERPIIGGVPDFGDPFGENEGPNPARRKSLKVGEQHIEAAVFSADGKSVAVRQFGKTEFWEIETGNHHPIDVPFASAFALSPDGKWLAAGVDGATVEVRLYDTETAALKKRLSFDQFDTLARSPLAFSGDGSVLAVGHMRGVRLWRTAGWEEMKTGIRQDFFHAEAMALSRDGSTLAVGPGNPFGGQGILLWDTRQGKEKAHLAGPGTTLEGLAFAPDDARVASAGFDDVKVWDVRRPNPAWTAQRDPFAALLAFSPDGQLLAITDQDGGLILADAVTGARRATVQGGWPLHGRYIAGQFSAGGATLLTASQQGAVEVWDVAALLKQGPKR
jgi:WD40 repeat protein